MCVILDDLVWNSLLTTGACVYGAAGNAYIMVPPSNTTSLEGSRVKLTCQADGFPDNITYRWYRDDATYRWYRDDVMYRWYRDDATYRWYRDDATSRTAGTATTSCTAGTVTTPRHVPLVP